jgi:hypothetical protein
VLQALIGSGNGCVLHFLREESLVLREVLDPSLHPIADVAVAQADNFIRVVPRNPMMNERNPLSGRVSRAGETLATFAYPGNRLDLGVALARS